jgi:hypothetical protein
LNECLKRKKFISVMFDLKTILNLIGVTSLLNEPPIKTICETFQIGANISIVDCAKDDEKCFIEKINADKRINKDNVITTVNWEDSVSTCIYKYNQIIFTIRIDEFDIFHHKNDVYRTGEDTFVIENIINALVIEIGKKANQR